MAKRDTGGVPRSFGVPGFSLESILEECRDKAPEETAAPETAETEYRPETEGYSSEQADYPAETEYEAEYPDEEEEYPEYEEFDTGEPEYETAPDTAPDGPEETGEPDGRYYEDAPEPEEAAANRGAYGSAGDRADQSGKAAPDRAPVVSAGSVSQRQGL